MLVPAFQFQLKTPIIKGLATVGKYDGKHPSLTFATSAGKVQMHNPFERSISGNTESRFLNINKQITALSAGALDKEMGRDVLMVGTATNLLVYDVEENSDIFYRDVPDGVNAMQFGEVGSDGETMCVVGGNCSIQGFDAEGNEVYWTVTGDNVTSLTLCDVDMDGKSELLVGSEDFEIRIYQDDEVLSEVTETDAVVGLSPLHHNRYGYALANGTIGVYEGSTRAWRVKSKNHVNTIIGFDLDGDGEPELISGWSSGRFEVRSDRSGEVIYKQKFPEPLAHLVAADYRMDGRTEVMACAIDGEVRGYLPADGELIVMNEEDTMENDAMKDLLQRKRELQAEITAYEEMAKNRGKNQGIVPSDTRVSYSWNLNQEEKCVELKISTTNNAMIRTVVIFAEQLFEGESFVIHATNPSNTVNVPLRPSKDLSTDLFVKVLVCNRANAEEFHVFEQAYKLPKFAMYIPINARESDRPVSSVTFPFKESVSRIVAWMKDAFNIKYDASDLSSVSVAFRSLRSGNIVWLQVAEAQKEFKIFSDEMEVCGEIIQDLSGIFGFTHLESVADFPKEMEEFKNVLMRVDEFNTTRLKLTAEMADSSNMVKALVIKAEDARILGDMDHMRKMYSELHNVNRELVGDHMKRANNHNELLAALKEVNQV
uniref:Bardet-Biedl syndrome 2 protein homolog n=1 Tax=Palpitomonas bilix TaxID=652834 RepID=A0A7S3GBK3_9EUKA|mmetsp:Transcript_39547/g.101543  ORF Transcript_39547/g.101543 Transcript_39547/m.101543 type:complete len:656 (+) Transcript_39547:133-2100(+)